MWCDAELASAHNSFHFWINAGDPDAGRLLRTFTLRDRHEVEAIDEALAAEMPSVRVQVDEGQVDIVAVLEQAFALSRTAARKLIQQGAVTVNGGKLPGDAQKVPAQDAVRGRWFLVRKGGRDIAIAEVAGR